MNKDNGPIQLAPEDFYQLLALVNAKSLAERDAELAVMRLQQAKQGVVTAFGMQQSALRRVAKKYKFAAAVDQFQLDDAALTIQLLRGK